LFKLDPERAHAASLALMEWAGRYGITQKSLGKLYSMPPKPVQAFGLTFRNPVGLAAGYDKDGRGWRGLASLGFGHIEIGTVTPRPQPGNPKPRLFRIPEESALINRMGFPGEGALVVAARLAGPRPPGVVLGVNLGKNKTTPLERAVEDYLYLFSVFATLADYLAINVSSPNTVGLRQLQARQELSTLLESLANERRRWLKNPGDRLPILVKLSPDLTESELEDAIEVIQIAGMDGVIATNTTLSRESIRSPLSSESGGLSGAPLRQLSTSVVERIHYITGGRLPVIAAGGVESARHAQEKLSAGASLVQVYTGMVYRGPGLVKDIVRGLVDQGMPKSNR
jgi:dihydroorotate dehydrogenase